MTVLNWQYDDLKETLRTLLTDHRTENRDVLYNCLQHFERFDLWMKRIQEAHYYEEAERKHVQRKLDRIKDIIERDINND